MNTPTIAERHKVTFKDQNRAFAELAYFLYSRIDETPEITPENLILWLAEHNDYAKSHKSELIYRQFSNRLKKGEI